MPRFSDRSRAIGIGIVSWCAASYLAYAWTALARLDLLHRPALLVAAAGALVALWLAAARRPVPVALLLIVLLPLFGNHPGGRLMELINLPLAASAAGLARQSQRQRRPVPGGPIWMAAGLVVVSAVLALLPSVPGMMVKAAQLNHAPTALMEALSASEDNPLYAMSSVVTLALAAAWGFALAWRTQPGDPSSPDDGRRILSTAVRAIVYTLFVVVGIGVLGYHGVIDLTAYFYWIDPRKPDLLGLQSIFWNPGWFAWYFVIAFALAIGWLWQSRGRTRLVVAALLAASYLYFFTNPQRGGFVALHASLAGAAAILFTTSATRTRRWLVPLGAVGVAAAIAGVYLLGLIPQELGWSLFRLVESPEETDTSNLVRRRLWAVAVDMWRDAPLFGIGEGSFDWRFEDYAPPGSAFYSPVHGDAHNTWMQILATRGLAGVFALALLCWATGRALLRCWRADREDGLIIGVALALAAFLVYSTVQGMFYLQSIQVLFWFLVAAASTMTGAGRLPAPWRVRRALVLLAVVGAIAAQLLVAAPAFDDARTVLARDPRGTYALERHPDEPRAWRWTTGRAVLCLTPQGETMRLALGAGDPRREEYPRRVTLELNGRPLEAFSVTGPDTVTRTLSLPPTPRRPPVPFGECTGRPGELRLGITVDRRWRPLAAGLGADPRTFGVRVYEPEYP